PHPAPHLPQRPRREQRPLGQGAPGEGRDGARIGPEPGRRGERPGADLLDRPAGAVQQRGVPARAAGGPPGARGVARRDRPDASAFTAPVRAISSSRSRSGNGVPSRHQRESSESRVSPAEWESRSRSVRSATGDPASSPTWSPTVSSSRSRPCSLSRMIASAVNVFEWEAIRRRCVVRSGIPADSSAEPTATSATSSPSCQIAAWKPGWRCSRRTVSSHSGSIAATSSTAERDRRDAPGDTSGDAPGLEVTRDGTGMASPPRSTVARADYGRDLPGGAVSITLVKPFVQIATRPEDDVAATEREAVLDFTGLAEDELLWARLDRDPFPDVGAADISGIILCGSPFTVSDPP